MADLPEVKVPQVGCCAIRVSQLDTDGTPTVGSTTSYTTDCLSKLTATPNYEDGQEIKEDNACGSTYIDFLAPASLTRGNLEIDLLAPDPILLKLLQSASSRIIGAWGMGWADPPLGPVTGQCAIELWAMRINNGKLDPTFPYAHIVFPFVKNVKLGAAEYANSAQHTIVTGEAYENSLFFDGPLNDWPAPAASRWRQWVPTATLPDATTGTYTTVASS